MKKCLAGLLLVSLLQAAAPLPPRPAHIPEETWEVTEGGKKFETCSTGCSWKGPARAAAAGNFCGLTYGQMAGGILVAGAVIALALLATNAQSHSH